MAGAFASGRIRQERGSDRRAIMNWRRRAEIRDCRRRSGRCGGLVMLAFFQISVAGNPSFVAIVHAGT